MIKDKVLINNIKNAIEKDLMESLKHEELKTYTPDELGKIQSELKYKIFKDCYDVMNKYPGIDIEKVEVELSCKLKTELKSITFNVDVNKEE